MNKQIGILIASICFYLGALANLIGIIGDHTNKISIILFALCIGNGTLFLVLWRLQKLKNKPGLQ